MNERLAQAGDQIKVAFVKVGDSWKAQEPKRKRLILIIGIGLIALALGLVIYLNVHANAYVELYAGMPQDEVTRAVGVLQTASIPARVDAAGNLEVPRKSEEAAMGQLAIQGIPATTLDYNILQQASGITTTESEKQQARINQWQDRLQDTIKSLNGVNNAIVTLNIQIDNNRVWDKESTKNTGSVTISMQPGYVLGADQAYGIRYLIGSSVGIDPNEVTVLDQNGNLLAKAGEEYDANATATKNFLERLDLARALEERLEDKARDVISLQYPNVYEDTRVNSTVTLDFDAVVREVKEYFPAEGHNGGLIDEEEVDAIMSPNEYAGGVVGETDNTDVPIYVDINGDDIADVVDYHHFRDYALNYTLEQIEKDGPSVTSATISVVVAGSLGNDVVQSMRQSVALATGLAVENVGVSGVLVPVEDTTGDTVVGPGLLGLPMFYWYIAIAVLVALILILVLVLVLRGRAKKKKLALELAEQEAEQAEADRIQQEIEERKKQLKNAAMSDESENAITNEVREFARNNPEITANLLRNWLKEGE